jgi:hypothetical protein
MTETGSAHQIVVVPGAKLLAGRHHSPARGVAAAVLTNGAKMEPSWFTRIEYRVAADVVGKTPEPKVEA